MGADHSSLVAEHRQVIRSEERGTASLDAACARRPGRPRGYPIAFHFDPVVIGEGCEEDYGRWWTPVRRCAPERIVWISLGAFRFMRTSSRRFSDAFPIPGSSTESSSPGPDGKARFSNRAMKVLRSLAQPFWAMPRRPASTCAWGSESAACAGVHPGRARRPGPDAGRAAVRHCGLNAQFRR